MEEVPGRSQGRKIMDFGFGTFGNLSNTSSNAGEAVGGSSTTFGGYGGFSNSDVSATDFFMSPKEAKEKKKAEEKEAAAKKKKEEAAAKKATPKKPVNDREVELPVEVIGRNIHYRVDGTGKRKLSEINNELVEKGYLQFSIPAMGLFYHEASNIVFVVDSAVTKEFKEDIIVDLKDGITVCDGMLQAELTMDDFEGMEEDEISLKHIIDKWVSINPSYAGCGMAYNEESSVFYPVLKELTEKDYKEKIHSLSSYLKRTVTYDVEEEKDYPSLLKELEPMLTDFGTDKVKVMIQYGSGNHFFVSYVSNEAYRVNTSSSVKKDKKVVEKKYNLPVTLFVVTWGAVYELTSEMFDGKEKVTFDEIKKVMATKERMFADSSRKIDTYYDEANNKISVMFVSGTKGCELIRSAEELERVKKLDTFDGNWCEDSNPFRIIVRMAGIFYIFLKRCVPTHLTFERKFPLIPHIILEDIIKEFKKDTTKEACCRIYYDFDNDKFIYQFAKGVFTKTAAYYDYGDNPELLKGKKVQILDIHSHNTMHDFFSGTDNNDDVYCGLFCVIGDLDKEEPSIELRAGANGMFSNIPLSDIFEMSV